MELVLLVCVVLLMWTKFNRVLRSRFQLSYRKQHPKVHFDRPTTAKPRVNPRDSGAAGKTEASGPTFRASTSQAIVIVEVSEITGKCWVIDGDTVEINGTRIRLAGIDAPELEDPYGKVARAALIRLCRGVTVRAVTEGQQSYNRLVATCFLPDGRDLSAEMVRMGMALDWSGFSRGKYRDLEPEGIRKRLWRCDARQKGRTLAQIPD